jgi:hypothetical protein
MPYDITGKWVFANGTTITVDTNGYWKDGSGNLYVPWVVSTAGSCCNGCHAAGGLQHCLAGQVLSATV